MSINNEQTDALRELLQGQEHILSYTEDDTHFYFVADDILILMILHQVHPDLTYQEDPRTMNYKASVLKPNWFTKGLEEDNYAK